MADDYDYDPDDGMPYDDDWLYVEDEYALADELAEGAIADPGYAGTNNEIEMEGFEYDYYAFWDDLEYGYDEYWDSGDARVPQEQLQGKATQSGQKRKRTVLGRHDAAADSKRRKVSDANGVQLRTAVGDGYDSILFMSWEQRLEIAARRPAALKKIETFALLPDWRVRYKDQDGVVSVEHMPVEMRMAAAAEGDVDIREEDDPEEEEWVGEDEDEEGRNDLPTLDPEMLQAILKAKLSEAGLDGVDEKVFMHTLSSMLTDPEGAGADAAGELANTLLGATTSSSSDPGGPLAGWLERQGVSLAATAGEDDDDDDDEVPSLATAELLTPAASLPRNKELAAAHHSGSTPDGGIDVPAAREMAMHHSSPTSANRTPQATRLADSQMHAAQRIAFDIPASSSTEISQPLGREGDATPAVSSPAKMKSGKAKANAKIARLGGKVELNGSAEELAPVRSIPKRKAQHLGEDHVERVVDGHAEVEDPVPQRAGKEPMRKKSRTLRARGGDLS